MWEEAWHGLWLQGLEGGRAVEEVSSQGNLRDAVFVGPETWMKEAGEVLKNTGIVRIGWMHGNANLFKNFGQ